MSEWSVFVAAASGRRLKEASIDAFLDALTPHAGVVGADLTRHAYDARFSVDAGDPIDAATRAVEIFRACAREAELPDAPIVRVEVMTAAELDRELARPAFPELVGIGEIAELLGVTRQRASAVQTNREFPAPVAQLKSGPVWTRSSIGHFLESWQRRPGRPRRVDDRCKRGDCEGRIVKSGGSHQTGGGNERPGARCDVCNEPYRLTTLGWIPLDDDLLDHVDRD